MLLRDETIAELMSLAADAAPVNSHAVTATVRRPVPAAFAPLGERARMSDGSMAVVAAILRVSVADFQKRYR